MDQQEGQGVETDASNEADNVKVITILNAIAGELLDKEATKLDKFTSRIGEPWPTKNNEEVFSFVNKIEKKFIRKSKLHGSVSENSQMGDILSDYVSNISSDGGVDQDCFMTFVKDTINNLVTHANDKQSGTLKGGSIIFLHYRITGDTEDSGRLLIVMVDKKGVFDFTEDLLPKKLVSIDTDALRQAASFDLNLFATVFHTQPTKTGDSNKDESYLMFIDGKSSSDFFKNALGCADLISDQTCLLEAEKAVNGYADALDASPPQKANLIRAFEILVEEKVKNKKPITLDEIQIILERAEPELVEKSSGLKFTDFANENEYKINKTFSVNIYNEKQIKNFFLNDTSEKKYWCRVKRDSIGSIDSKKPVKISPDKKYLMIPIGDDLSDEQIELLIS
ncbi:nucleoid-associated protein [Vogesella sp. GCM10023246]|uniref:Nucleoid-associated protein n=2 Tax=Chromobacteriaceae TaxID=1499392 RepID=A0ABV1MB75_9NEIS